jgi:hypothetical protein
LGLGQKLGGRIEVADRLRSLRTAERGGSAQGPGSNDAAERREDLPGAGAG